MLTKHWKPLLTLALLACGFACGATRLDADDALQRDGYTCPLTGEILPCPDCCPANQEP